MTCIDCLWSLLLRFSSHGSFAIHACLSSGESILQRRVVHVERLFALRAPEAPGATEWSCNRAQHHRAGIDTAGS